MAKLKLFYATNRNHEGKNQWKPKRYGSDFSKSGRDNLRLGEMDVTVDDNKISKLMQKSVGPNGTGDGESMLGYIAKCAKTANIRAYEEKLDPDIPDHLQKDKKLGSAAMFKNLKALMDKKSDVLVYVHGFNVSWEEAVGSALTLKLMLNREAAQQAGDPSQEVEVILFSWPSDGSMLPYVAYKSDRGDAEGSGYAFGRALLKLRDYLNELRIDLRDRKNLAERMDQLCGQHIHLLCHSMGNYLLENIIDRMWEHTPGNALPRLFEHIFLCAPDVDDDALEPGKPLGLVHELAKHVTVYHNNGDAAMVISDYTKANPDRLGAGGAARPTHIHKKVHQVDCTDVAEGLVEHSYYLSGNVNIDIRQSIDEFPIDSDLRKRVKDGNLDNIWKMIPVDK